jgi:hypothetical protein
VPNVTKKIETLGKFHHPGMARSFANRCHKIALVVHGDDRLFWVVTPAVGERLVRDGYEYAD